MPEWLFHAVSAFSLDSSAYVVRVYVLKYCVPYGKFLANRCITPEKILSPINHKLQVADLYVLHKLQLAKKKSENFSKSPICTPQIACG